MINNSYHPEHTAWRLRSGLSIEEASPTSVVLNLPPLPHNINLSGTVHGGIGASASLEAALILAAQNELLLFPVSMRTSYLHGGKAEDSHIIATVMNKTRSYLFVRADMFDNEQQLLTSSDIILRKRTTQATETHFQTPPLKNDNPADYSDYTQQIQQAQQKLNARQTGFSSGLTLEHLSPGYCIHRQDNVDATREPNGALALGAIIKAADDCGSLCSHLLKLSEAKLSATLSLQLSFHCPPSNAAVELHGQTMTRQDGVAHNRVIATDTTSEKLILTGEVCHLLR